MSAMLFVTWFLVVLLFNKFENTCATEISNETSWNTEIPFVFRNTSFVSNESYLYPNPIPPSIPLTPIFNGTCDFSTCPETFYSIRDRRACKCDKYCIEFRDCCFDSEYYDEEEQRNPVQYECHKIGNSNYFVKRTCASSWDDVEISDKCAMSIRHELDTEEIDLRTPVTSSATNITYGNVYCAFCNYELDDVVLWDVSVGNCFTIWTIRLNDSDVDLPKVIKTLTVFNDNNSNSSENPIEVSFRDLTFNNKRWYYEDGKTRYDCDLILNPPSSLQLQYCLNDPVIRDCPLNWTDRSIAEQCKSNHSKVYDWHGTAYRNKYCAHCNGLNDSDLTCYKARAISAYSDIMTIRSHPGPKQQFTILFDFKLRTDSRICNETKKSYQKIQKKLCPRNTKSYGSNKPATHDNWFLSALSVYTFIAVLVSLIFLLLHLTIFSVVRELQTISGKNLASFCIALILAYSSFLLGNFVDDYVCFVTAVLMYYSFLSAFFWMLIISYDMWHTFWNATKKFRSPKNVKKTFVIYSILVWTMPLILVCTTLYFDLVSTQSVLAPHFGYSGCWFDNGFSLLVFFVGPVCAILIINFALFVHTSYMLHSSRCESVNQKSRVDFKLFTRIALLTGFTWITGFIAGYTQNLIIWFIFVVLNTAQGIFIFTAFSCKKRVIRSFLKRINKFEKWQRHLDENNVTSNFTTASTPLNVTVVKNS